MNLFIMQKAVLKNHNTLITKECLPALALMLTIGYKLTNFEFRLSCVAASRLEKRQAFVLL
jgi:hypothetical protein